MNRIFHPLLALIASATDRELARYVEFLKTENQIFRTRIKRQIHTRPHEREKLVSLGKKIGRAVEELITIVHRSTFYRWGRNGFRCEASKVPQSSFDDRSGATSIRSGIDVAGRRVRGSLRCRCS